MDCQRIGFMRDNFGRGTQLLTSGQPDGQAIFEAYHCMPFDPEPSAKEGFA